MNTISSWIRSLCERAILWALGPATQAAAGLQSKRDAELQAQIAELDSRLTTTIATTIADIATRLKEAEAGLKESDAALWERVREHLSYLHASKRDVPGIVGPRPVLENKGDPQ
jgi:hypothetical protein